MKLKIILGSLLFLLSVAGLAQQSGSDKSDGADDFDLNALVSRISQSKALGLFTKLCLKHDIDELLENVRKYHDGSGHVNPSWGFPNRRHPNITSHATPILATVSVSASKRRCA